MADIKQKIEEKQIEVYMHIGGENPFDVYNFVDAGIAVAQCRGFDYGALIYGGDDVASEEWNSRGWNTRQGIRYNLILLCKELVQEM